MRANEPPVANLAGYKDVAIKIHAAQKARNRFIHSSLGQDPNTKEFKVAVGSARGSVTSELQKVTLDDIRRAWREVNSAGAALHNPLQAKRCHLIPDP